MNKRLVTEHADGLPLFVATTKQLARLIWLQDNDGTTRASPRRQDSAPSSIEMYSRTSPKSRSYTFSLSSHLLIVILQFLHSICNTTQICCNILQVS